MIKKSLTITNLVTLFRIFLLPFIVFFLINDERLIAFFLMLLAFLSDVVDGYIARRLHQESELGKILDHLCDKLSLLVILITLLIINAIPFWVVIFIGIRDILILLGSFILYKRRMIIYKSNILGKITGFLFGGMILAFILGCREIGMMILYIAIPVMLAAFITYLKRYLLALKCS